MNILYRYPEHVATNVRRPARLRDTCEFIIHLSLHCNLISLPVLCCGVSYYVCLYIYPPLQFVVNDVSQILFLARVELGVFMLEYLLQCMDINSYAASAALFS